MNPVATPGGSMNAAARNPIGHEPRERNYRMQNKALIRDITQLCRLPGAFKYILIILAACLPLMAAQSQKETARNDCARYTDPSTLTPLKKYKHPALDQGCTVCHLDCNEISHAAGSRKLEPPYLKAEEPDLCLECHSASKQDLSETHGKQPLAQVRCSGCHDAHSSNSPERIPDVSHGPFEARLCSSCHAAPLDGMVQLTATTTDALCYGCHSEFKASVSGAKSRHMLFSLSSDSCIECHDPHAANQAFVLKKPARDLCIGCHTANAEKDTPSAQPKQPGMKSYLNLSSRYVHEPAGVSCLFCHDAHASDFPYELHAPMPGLCMGCHGANAEKIVQSTQPFPLFEGRSVLPPKIFEKLPSLDLSLKYVHEPVGVSCAFCHNAHASSFPKELHAPVHELCIACHGPNAQKIVQSEEPFPLFDSHVSLPAKVFKKLTGLVLTPDGKRGHPEEGHLVFVPATDKKPEFNCLTCHTPHATDANDKLVVKHKEFNCLDCHN